MGAAVNPDEVPTVYEGAAYGNRGRLFGTFDADGTDELVIAGPLANQRAAGPGGWRFESVWRITPTRSSLDGTTRPDDLGEPDDPDVGDEGAEAFGAAVAVTDQDGVGVGAPADSGIE